MTTREMRGQLHAMLKEQGVQPGTKMDVDDDEEEDEDDEEEGYETIE